MSHATRSVTLEHKQIPKIEEIVEKGGFRNFSEFIRFAIDEQLRKTPF